MRKINTLLIDDEISAINTLRGMLTQYCPQVKIVGEACSTGEAIQQITRHKPDLIFLDIEMPPYGNAFDLLKQMREPEFGVIFTTAYPQYAIEAINTVQPWAYLVKPYSVKSLEAAVKIAGEKLLEEGNMSSDHHERLGFFINDSRKGTIVIRFHEVLFCNSDGSVVEITLLRNNKLEKITTYRTLKELENDFEDQPFCRTHHSYIVNLSHILRFEKTGRNGIIHLTNGIRVGISVQKMAEFEQRFEQYLMRT